MTKRKLLSISAAILIGSGALVSVPKVSSSLTGCCLPDFVVPFVAQAVVSANDGFFAAMLLAMNAQLVLSGNDIANTTASQGSRYSEQIGKSIDGWAQNETSIQRKRENLETKRSHAENPVSYQPKGGTNHMVIAEETLRQRMIKHERQINEILDNAPDTYAQDGSLQGFANAALRRRTLYCNPETYGSSACNRDLSTSEEFDKTDADVRPMDTLFNDEAIHFDSSNGASQKWEMEAAHDLIDIMIRPFPGDKVYSTTLLGGDGPTLERQRSAANARLLLASMNWNIHRELRTPTVDAAEWVEDMRERGAFADSSTNVRNLFTGQVGDKVSMYQIMKVLYSERQKDPVYMDRTRELDTTEEHPEAQRELVTLMAMHLTLQWEQYKMMERIQALKAALLAVEVENSRTDFKANKGGSGGGGQSATNDLVKDANFIE